MYLFNDNPKEEINIKKKKEFVDFRWKEYRPRYYRSVSDVPDTLEITPDYDKKDYVSFIRKPKKSFFIIDKGTDDMKSMKFWTILRRSSGAFLALVIFASIIILAVNYINVQSKETEVTEEVTTESSESSTTNDQEAVTYDKETGLAIYSNDFNLMVISPSNTADETFTVETTNIGGVEVDSRIADALSLMLSAAEEDGVTITLSSGYISYEDQEKLFEDEVARLEKKGTSHLMSEYTAELNVSRAGESDAQTGLSVVVSNSSKDFTTTSQYTWLTNHAAEYGFTFRYPENDSDYTGHQADLTVIRYVGSDNAVKMRQLDMCLEEYINYIYDK